MKAVTFEKEAHQMDPHSGPHFLHFKCPYVMPADVKCAEILIAGIIRKQVGNQILILSKVVG